MTLGFLSIALVGYIVGIVLAAIATLYHSRSSQRGASLVFVVTWLAHLGAVVQAGVAAGGVPLSNLAQYLLVFSWIVLTIHLWVWFKLKIHVAGLVLPPLAALAAFASLQLGSGEATRSASPPAAVFLFHTTVATLGMGFLGLTCAMSVLYLVQDRALKSKKKTLALLKRLPSLQKCDEVGFRSLVVGFALLTLGIATGLVVNTEVYQKLWVWDAKSTFPLAAWVVFAVILIARTVLGFRGRKSAYLTITGFTLGCLTVIGMTL
jgi:ABC-type uncharacterized transport system permease subunit